MAFKIYASDDFILGPEIPGIVIFLKSVFVYFHQKHFRNCRIKLKHIVISNDTVLRIRTAGERNMEM